MCLLILKHWCPDCSNRGWWKLICWSRNRFYFCRKFYCKRDHQMKEEDFLLFPPVPGLKLRRAPTNEEKFEISLSKLFCSFFTSSAVLSLLIFTTLSLYSSEEVSNLFICDPDNEKSIPNIDFPAGTSLSDVNLDTYCKIKSFLAIFSCILLFPQLIQTVSATAVLLYSTEPSVKLPISDRSYYGISPFITECLHPDLLKRILWILPSVVQLPRYIYKNRPSGVFCMRILFMILFLLPRVLLSLSLIPFSFFLISASKGLLEVFSSFVISQFVGVFLSYFSMLSGREQVGEDFWGYTKRSRKAVEAVQDPITDFAAGLTISKFGLPVPRAEKEPFLFKIQKFFRENIFSCCFEGRKRVDSITYFERGMRYEDIGGPDDLFMM
eukprot:maker-scaffold_51-snap-gene-0.6-mRNA-1 protein AED:0.26 eAED:0.26 QI:19/1/1/1/1/1/2/115/381